MSKNHYRKHYAPPKKPSPDTGTVRSINSDSGLHPTPAVISIAPNLWALLILAVSCLALAAGAAQK